MLTGMVWPSLLGNATNLNCLESLRVVGPSTNPSLWVFTPRRAKELIIYLQWYLVLVIARSLISTPLRQPRIILLQVLLTEIQAVMK